jgi:glycosyltransferase involved in cell wall biosynthesis
MSPPLISVIIPAYNAEPFIDEAIQGVLAQDYPRVEVIVVDDGSTDGTAQRVAAYGTRVQYHRRANSGGFPGVTRNTGIGYAQGELLCFLDADDVMLPGRLTRQAVSFADHPKVGLAFANYRNFRSGETAPEETHFETCLRLQRKFGGRDALVLPGAEATTLLIQENFGSPSSMMLRRSVLEQVPPFSPDLQTSEDFHFFYRLAKRYDIAVIRQLGSLRRLHGSNITGAGNSLRVLHNYITSRTQLRAVEDNPVNQRLLDDFLYGKEIELARAYGNERRVGLALSHNLRALTTFSPISVQRLVTSGRILARTVAIAMHVKAPSP